MILHIDSSVLGENSVSRQLTAAIVTRLATAGEEVRYRDLVATPLAHYNPAQPEGGVLDEFMNADTVVIGAPMYNFTIPSQLKSWIDNILIAGKTFKYTETGSVGLAGPKRVVIAAARGGFYGEAPMSGFEHAQSYLTVAFGFIGITPEFVIAEGIAISPENREKAIDGALGEILALAA